MKKRFLIFAVILAMTLALGGCAGRGGAESAPPDSAAPESPSDPAGSEAPDESAPVGEPSESVKIGLATDELLSAYDSFNEFTADENGEKLILWTETGVTDFVFMTVEHDATGDEVVFRAGDVLASYDELSPEKPFVVELLTPGMMPGYGISFVDENGAQRYYTINLDGRGAEEAPPYFLLEFENAAE